MARMARGAEFVEAGWQSIANAKTLEQLRQAQAVVLPVCCGMSLEESARLIGVSKGWVSKLRNRFMQGKVVGSADLPARGGRRRQHFTFEREAELLKPFLQKASEGGILVVSQIRLALEAALGRPMALSTVYALLHRHNWRKLAPDKQHPQSDPPAQEDFKKTPGNALPSPETGQRVKPSA